MLGSQLSLEDSLAADSNDSVASESDTVVASENCVVLRLDKWKGFFARGLLPALRWIWPTCLLQISWVSSKRRHNRFLARTESTEFRAVTGKFEAKNKGVKVYVHGMKLLDRVVSDQCWLLHPWVPDWFKATETELRVLVGIQNLPIIRISCVSW